MQTIFYKLMYNGVKIIGDGRGKKMGFPTLNILMKTHPDTTGVFIVSVTIGENKYFGLLHLGPRPTFHQDEYRIEIFLLYFSGHIPLNAQISFTLLEKIREVIAFSSAKKLIDQIEKDRVFAENFIKTLDELY